MGERPNRMRDAERELIREIYPGLRRYAAVVAPAETEPEDLVQEALYRVLRSGPLTRFEHPAAYLRRALTNLAANERRRLGRGRVAVNRLSAADGMVESYPSELEDLLRIPDRWRAAVFLRVVEGRDYDEIAAALGCREATARSLASRGLRRLRTLLSEEVRDATA